MTLVPALIAPLLMTLATLVERRLGSSAAGWVAALPVSLGVSLLAVDRATESSVSSTMALSAAGHVAAQVVFGVLFASLVHRGLLVGIGAGILGYAAASVGLWFVPVPVAIALAVPLLGLAPRLIRTPPPRPVHGRHQLATAIAAGTSLLIVVAAVLVAGWSGPMAAGIVAAFPTTSAALALLAGRHSGRPAAGQALLGLVRGLPCYLVFAVVSGLAIPIVGSAGLVVGLVAGLAVARLTWSRVPTVQS